MHEAWLERTEQYFNNEMSAEERLLFEAELKKNDELSAHVNLYKEIETEMRNRQNNSEQEEALKASLNKLTTIYFGKEIEKDLKNPGDARQGFAAGTAGVLHQHKKTIKTRSIFAIAAMVTGFIVLSVTWYVNNIKKNATTARQTQSTDTGKAIINADINHLQKGSNASNPSLQNNVDSTNSNRTSNKKREQLFADNFKPDVTPVITEGPLEDAFTYYANHRYSKAAEEFSTANFNTTTRSFEPDPKLTAFYAYYYAGLSYLANGQTTQAIPKLKHAVSKSRGSLKIKAEWYLSLSYLKNGQVTNANELLKKISSDVKENKYSLKAAKLLDELTAQ